MSLSLIVGPLTSAQFIKALEALTAAGFDTSGEFNAAASMPAVSPAGSPVAPPPKPVGAMPPMPGGSPAPAALPPPPATAAPANTNAKLETVLKLMDAYSRAGHQVAGARKVLAMLGLSRAQDATEEQLDWLASAFANTGWAP